jgi:hypothetical protein
MMSDDMALVREYAANQSEQAFETLVSRYVGLVHSAALRQVRNPQLADSSGFQVIVRYSGAKGGFAEPENHLGWLVAGPRYFFLRATPALIAARCTASATR